MPAPRIDPALYPEQLAAKLAQFEQDFAALSPPSPSVFPSAPVHYRLRAEFRAWHHGDAWDYAMFDPENPRRPVLMQDFPVASQHICELMPRLR
ncbi:MAG: tRNA (uridine(54)-C5)-methyltransferase TrmA, partial [Azonexus sp.]|nr:tRNA (uridine(54)-C5)-methyltransferase TrmA [Azonexus sp.]